MSQERSCRAVWNVGVSRWRGKEMSFMLERTKHIWTGIRLEMDGSKTSFFHTWQGYSTCRKVWWTLFFHMHIVRSSAHQDCINHVPQYTTIHSIQFLYTT